MELIKIIFFVIGSFFGLENSRVVAEKTTVTINPEEKTIHVLYDNIITIIQNKSDSTTVQNELKKIMNSNQNWDIDFESYAKKEKIFYAANGDTTLNGKLSLTYTNITDLKIFGIELDKNKKYTMTNFPSSNMSSTDGVLGERYWTFNSDKSFTFVLEPMRNMPEEYKAYIKSTLPYWKKLKN